VEKTRYFFLICSLLLSTQLFAQDVGDLMEMSLDDLLNMEVTTASKSAEKLSDAPGIVSVVTQDEIQRFGGTTLRDILERVPGLASSGANYTNRTTIAPRGDQIKQNSSHVLMLINGRPIREVQEGGVSSDVLESFPVRVIERIEVIRGPGSVLYGSDAFSGVINIITKKAEENNISVASFVEPEGGYETSSEVTFTKGDFSILAAGRLSKKAEWETPYTAMVGVDTVTFQPILFTANPSIPDKGPGAYLGLNYKGLNVMTSYNKWETLYFNPGLYDNIEVNKLFTNLGYAHKISKSWDMDFNFTYVKSELLGANLSARNSYNLVAEWTNSFVLGNKTNLVVGGLYNRNKGEEKSFFQGMTSIISEGNVNSFAFYSQLDYQLLKNLKLISGMQANKVENIDLNIVPRGGLIWYPAEKVNVKALYSEAFRAPSINEVNMNFFGILNGNPNLKPEKVSTMDFSVGYQGDKTNLALNMFRSRMTDIIQIVYGPTFTGTYENNQDVTFMGVEFEGKYYVNRHLYLNGSLLYQTNENDEVKQLSPIANFGAKAGASYVWDSGITLGLFNIYQGEPDDKFQGVINPYQGSYNLLHLHSEFNLNKLFNWSFKQKLAFVLNVDNLLDKEHYGYDLGGTSGDGIPSFPGRRVYLGLNASLN